MFGGYNVLCTLFCGVKADARFFSININDDFRSSERLLQRIGANKRLPATESLQGLLLLRDAWNL